MGERRHERQLAEAETKYMAAVFRLLKAMNTFDARPWRDRPRSCRSWVGSSCYHGFRSRFGVAVEAAGLGDVTPHDLRATHATWVADSHGVLVAARRLGHSNASVTTRHYARPVDRRDVEVARHLDQLGQGTDDSLGTQRARKSRQDGE